MTSPLFDPLSEWASLLMSSLSDAGLTDLVVSPGSRSTPFLLAAAREKRLTLHDVIDERAAAFFALGLARAKNRPIGLLCTSGSAPAHWFPAVVEASRAFLPLLLLSADRPTELQENGAAQTIDQTKLFGDHVRLFLDSGLPDPSPVVLRGLRRMAAQLFHTAQFPTPGPVQLNLRARKPLEPRPAESDADRNFARLARSIAERGAPVAVAAQTFADPDALRAVAGSIARASRGVIVAGAGNRGLPTAATLARFSAQSGFPLLCDATSGLRSASQEHALASSDAILSSPTLLDARPDCIIQLGPAPLTSSWDHLCSASSIETHAVIAEHGWQDPASSATHLVHAPIEETLAALGKLLPPSPPSTAWREKFAALDLAVQRETHLLLEDGRLSEASAARTLANRTAPGSALVVGNSLPIRLVEAWGGLIAKGLALVTQRGANGIDGLIAGAAGVARAGRETVLLLGDVSAAHDLSSLGLALRCGVKIVLLDNGGGRIFEQLPLAQAKLGDAEMAHFITPPEIDFRSAANAFGLRWARPASIHQLEQELATAGAALLEIKVPARESLQMRRELQHRADACAKAIFG